MVGYRRVVEFVVTAAMVIGCRAQHASTLTTFVGQNLNTMILIPEGMMETTSPDPGSWDAEVREQLQYLVGQFRARGGVIDLSRLEVDIAATPKERLGRPMISYAARIPVTWQGAVSVQRSGHAILPRRGDAPGRQIFHSAYSTQCSLAPSGVAQYWFYFSFDAKECGLSPNQYDKTLAIVLSYDMIDSEATILAKKPPYAAIWADSVLQITSIFEREFSGQGELKRRIAQRLQATYGVPLTTEKNGIETQVFSLPEGRKLVWQIIMLEASRPLRAFDGIATADVVFDTSADGLSAMYRRSQALGVGSQNKLYVATGSGSFAYVDRRILGEGFSGPISAVIAQAVPAFASAHSETHLQIIAALVAASAPYSELVPVLRRLSPTAVAGDRDDSEMQPARETDLFFGFF